MLISTEVEVRISGNNTKHFEDLGYKIPKYKNSKNAMVVKRGTSILVKTTDLMNNSSVLVTYECDYCGENKELQYKDYYKMQHSSIVNKDCCYNCRHLKKAESDPINYGVEHTTQLKSTQEKMKETMMLNYGVEYPVHSLEIREKIAQTNVERYGFPVAFQSKEVQDKFKNTCLERYGVEHPMHLSHIQKKVKNTNFKRYGGSPMNNYKIKEKAMVNQRIAFYKNGSAPSSIAQRYICKILNGKLNYPFYTYSLDVAFPNKKVYIEWDGGGHDLDVRIGVTTPEEKRRKELKRWYNLNYNKWREIRIISLQDKVPSNEKIIEMFKMSMEYLKTEHSWIRFDIDKGLVSCSNYEKYYNFGELRKITEEDLIEIGINQSLF